MNIHIIIESGGLPPEVEAVLVVIGDHQVLVALHGHTAYLSVHCAVVHVFAAASTDHVELERLVLTRELIEKLSHTAYCDQLT